MNYPERCPELPETYNQKCIRSWETAKVIVASLRKEGKLNDIPECNSNQIQIELIRNVVCRVNSSGKISYGYGLRFYGEKGEWEKRLRI